MEAIAPLCAVGPYAALEVAVDSIAPVIKLVITAPIVQTVAVVEAVALNTVAIVEAVCLAIEAIVETIFTTVKPVIESVGLSVQTCTAIELAAALRVGINSRAVRTEIAASACLSASPEIALRGATRGVESSISACRGAYIGARLGPTNIGPGLPACLRAATGIRSAARLLSNRPA